MSKSFRYICDNCNYAMRDAIQPCLECNVSASFSSWIPEHSVEKIETENFKLRQCLSSAYNMLNAQVDHHNLGSEMQQRHSREVTKMQSYVREGIFE